MESELILTTIVSVKVFNSLIWKQVAMFKNMVMKGCRKKHWNKTPISLITVITSRNQFECLVGGHCLT